MSVLKEKRKEAAERQNLMASKKYEEEYNEYKVAFKKEKKIADACSKEFDKLMSILEELDDKLNSLRVEFKSFVELCKLCCFFFLPLFSLFVVAAVVVVVFRHPLPEDLIFLIKKMTIVLK